MKRVAVLAVTAGAASFSWPSAAALIEADHPVFGPGSLTIDTDSGLRWLDITETVNFSFDAVSAEFAPGGAFEGFRHSTVAELVSLWNAAGIPCEPTLACDYNEGPVGGDPPNAGADILLPLVGWTQTTSTTFVAEGIVDEPGPVTGEHYRGSLEGARFRADHTQVGFPGGLPDSHSSADFGHWLVVVPEPSSGVLVVAGLLSLGIQHRFNRRRPG